MSKKFIKQSILAMGLFFVMSHMHAYAAKEKQLEKNYFQFVISKYHTLRQGGQTVNIYVRYAYKQGLPTNEYCDYRKLRERVLKYMEPTDDFPTNVYWEILATEMGRELIDDFPLDGVSVQLEVLDNPSGEVFEPGDHGPIFTTGNIAPLSVFHN